MARQSGAALLPMTNVPRPALPMAHFNILIKNCECLTLFDSVETRSTRACTVPDAPPVKYQKIQRPPKEVMVRAPPARHRCMPDPTVPFRSGG
jgi:hypothetical protein